MQTIVKNKAVIEKKTKEIETKTIEVNLKNTTSINGKLFQKWINKLTSEEYEAVKMFL